MSVGGGPGCTSDVWSDVGRHARVASTGWSARIGRRVGSSPLGVVAGFAIGLLAFAAGATDWRILLLFGLLIVGVGLVATLGVERTCVAMILLNLPLQMTVYPGWRDELGELSAVAGLPISLSLFALLGLVASRWFSGQSLSPWSAMRSARSRTAVHAFVAFTVVAVASAVFAPDSVFALNQLAVYVQALVLYGYLTSAFVRLDLHWVLELLVVGVLIQAALMGAQLVGLAEVETVWRTQSGTDVTQRLSGLLGSPNLAASYLSVLAIIVLAGVLWRTTRARTTFRVLGLLAGVVGLAFTLSRGGLLAFGAGAAALLGLGVYRRRVPTSALLVLMALFVVIAAAAGGELLQRVADDEGAASGRVPLLELAWTMWRDHPLTGVGLNNFTVVLPDYLTPEFANEWINVVHNQYMLILSESGPLALVAFLYLMYTFVALAWAASTRLYGTRAVLALGVVGALVARSVHMFFDVFAGLLQWETLIVVAALGTALHERAARSGDVPRDTRALEVVP